MISLTTPILKNQEGRTFHLARTNFDFDRKQMECEWQIKGTDGAVIFTGFVIFKDTPAVMNEENELVTPEVSFTNWYETEYVTHSDLVEKVAELAGYSGEYIGQLI
jgi:hypothetical protein